MKTRMFNMFVSLRRKVAGWFGHKEHTAGRLLGVFSFANLMVHADLFGYLVFITWLVYIISHTLEKKTYGKFGYR